MNLQPALLSNLDEFEIERTDPTIQERFEAFHAEHPEVFGALRSVCLDMKARGMPRWSIKAAYEAIRWEPLLAGEKRLRSLCNDFHSRYSDMLMARVPELADFFECRPRRSL
jgi:hypothetical protein